MNPFSTRTSRQSVLPKYAIIFRRGEYSFEVSERIGQRVCRRNAPYRRKALSARSFRSRRGHPFTSSVDVQRTCTGAINSARNRAVRRALRLGECGPRQTTGMQSVRVSGTRR